MNEVSVKLLKEVNSGFKNATDSFGQVREFVKDETLLALIDDYSQKHAEIGDQCHQMLNDQGEDEKDPPSVAKAVMRFTTEVKMMVDGDDSHAADLLADGCYLGIKSLINYIRQYKEAGQQELSLASRLIGLEFELYRKLMAYL